MDLTWTVEWDAEISLVCCRVHNDDAVRRRIRIENRLDGPVLPPRRAGVPEAGWDARGVTLRLAPDERRALGFAVPAQPVEPPVEVIDIETVEPNANASEIDQPADDGVSSAAAAALRDLADHRPPRAAVTERTVSVSESALGGNVESIELDGAGLDETDPNETEFDRTGRDETDDDDGGRERDSIGVDPPPTANRIEEWCIEEWFDAIETRLELTEQLTDADLETATAVVEASDGVGELAALDERVTADAERLREVIDRASSLATRAEATDAPIEALERLA